MFQCDMVPEYSLEELAAAVQAWSAENQVLPANGQAAEAISERTVRYYRTLGLLDAPAGNYTKTFSEKHRLQLAAIRLLQSYGLPLRKIREELYGKSLEELSKMVKQARKGHKLGAPLATAFVPPLATESWTVSPLEADFILVSRGPRQLPRAVIEKINQLIASTIAGPEACGDRKKK